MTSKLTNLWDGLLESGWLAAIISIPIFFNIHSERVFEPDKIAILRSIAVFILAIWLIRFVDRRGWQELARLKWRHEDSIWRIPLLLPIVALSTVYLLSTLFSITPRTSWAGSYQRLQGTYTTIAYIVFFIAVISTMRARPQIARIPTAVIVATIPIAFYGILQHFGLDTLPWGGDVIERVAANMGNAIFISAFLIMVVPLTLGRIIDAFTNILGDEVLSIADITRSAIYIFVLAIQLLAIFWSGSRGPLIALAVALFAFILVLLVSLRNTTTDSSAFSGRDFLFALAVVMPPFIAFGIIGLIGSAASPTVSLLVFFGSVLISLCFILLLVVMRRGWKWLWLSWLLLTIIVGGWLLLFNLPSETQSRLSAAPLVGGTFVELQEWKQLPTIGAYGRMLDPSQSSGRDKSNRVRVLIWQGVVDLVTPHDPLTYPDGRTDIFNILRPLLGYGPESMYVAYNRFYPPELATVEARNASPDRSHNETFDALVITGLAGFLAWQALYISVFYYGFRFLSVIRTRRDSTVFILCWIGGALIGAILCLILFQPIYLGVAVPTGTILGLIVYLFYYAIFLRALPKDEHKANRSVGAFESDNLLVNALLTGILAHYVEVHFGIAIAATRLNFFLFAGLIVVIAYQLPRLKELAVSSAGRVKKAGRQLAASPDPVAVWSPILAWTFLLALLVGTLGYDFTSYVLAPDKVVQSGTDITAVDIFQQSFFVNTQRSFADSPFIFLMVILSWGLGVLIILSEMIKNGTYALDLPVISKLEPLRHRLATGWLLVMGATSAAAWFLLPNDTGPSVSIARSLSLLGAIACFLSTWFLQKDEQAGRAAGISVAMIGIILSMPLLVAGGFAGSLVLAASCSILLYLLWDASLRPLVLPPAVFALLSLAIGLFYSFLHAVLLREALLYLVFLQSIEPISFLFNTLFRPAEAITRVQDARVFEARQAIHLLTAYYIFLFTMLILAGLSFARKAAARMRSQVTVPIAFGALLALFIVAIVVAQTNVRPVQADMVFKRARPFEEQATNRTDVLSWDTAIAIYQEALKLAPLEDFYYLFLGRAYLERAGITEDAVERATLLEEAERQLVDARLLNPLNTDHSANLARLNARLAAASDNANERQALITDAESYYADALELSPQNSLIRNELATITFDLKRDCAASSAIFQESLEIDPFNQETYFIFADVLTACAEAQSGSEQSTALYEASLDVLEDGLILQPERIRAWLQAGQNYQRLGRFERAIGAYERARELSVSSGSPTWNIDFYEADVYREMGDPANARALVEQALQTAPPEAAAQLQTFLESLR